MLLEAKQRSRSVAGIEPCTIGYVLSPSGRLLLKPVVFFRNEDIESLQLVGELFKNSI